VALELIPPESVVTLAGGVTAGVLQVAIGPNGHVRYEVAYWANGARVVQWLEAVEVRADDGLPPLVVEQPGAAGTGRRKELADIRAGVAALVERLAALDPAAPTAE
jgi:hypothetical protein